MRKFTLRRLLGINTDMIKFITKNILLPLYLKRSRNNVLARAKELEESQFFSFEKINAMQFQNMRKLLIHCYQNVPFYTDRFDSVGFRPEMMTSIEDIKQIPYLTKNDVQMFRENLIAKNYNISDLIPDASGGSTGRPTAFFKDKHRHQIRRADQIRHDRWTGWDIGDKFVTLWGAQREFDPQIPLRTKIIEKYIYRVFGFNAFDITTQKVLEYLEELKNIRPAMILAYANVAYLFARIIETHHIDLSGLKLKGLISSAETLTNEKRKAIQSAFHCDVYNRYGSREVGLIASECQFHEGLHINSENVYVEIQAGGKDVASGEMGEVIVTDFWNYGMPFVRYQMGDVAVQSNHKCSCGRSLPLLQEVTGRLSDFIVDCKGGLVHGEYFTHLFYGVDGIRQFQLIQERIDKIIIKIVPDSGYNSSALEPIISKIRLCIGGDLQLKVELCDQSLIEESGKFRFTISKIPLLHHAPSVQSSQISDKT